VAVTPLTGAPSDGRHRRRWTELAIALVLAVASVSCSGDPSDTATAPATSAPVSAGAEAPVATTLPDITEVPAPEPVDDEAFGWFVHPAPSGGQLLFGVLRSSAPLPHPAVLLVHASAGLTVDSVTFGEALAARGLDVVIGCWFASDPPPDLAPQVIPCGDAPPFRGVVDAAVPDLDALVEASHDALGADGELAILGTSRGAALAALRATRGAREPVVLVSGPYEGWNLVDDPPRAEVDVVARVARTAAPALIAHGTDDLAVPVSQAEHLETALRAHGTDVEAAYYAAGHNLFGDPAVADDLVPRLHRFLCTRLTCAPAT
jgi:dienelactone hydrolase